MIYTTTYSLKRISFLFFLMAFLSVNSIMRAQTPGGVTTGLNLWLDASDGAAVSGNNLTGWTDKTAINTFTVSALPPTVTANAINFHSTVDFNNSTATDVYPGEQSLVGNTAINYTDAYAVFKVNDGNGGVIIGGTIPGSSYGKAVFAEFNSGINSGTGDPVTYSNFPFTDFENYHVFGMDTNISGNLIGRLDGLDQSVTNSTGFSSINLVPTIGTTNNNGNLAGWNHLKGQIAEVIIYDQSTAGNRINIESYLALKYGIHKAGNYVSSANTVIWNAIANAGYDNDVFGIGQDDASGLNQSTSNSVNTGSGDGTGQSGKGNIVISNPSGLTNNSFLLVGHDTGVLTEANITLAGHSTKRITRMWKVQSTGNPGTVTLDYDKTGLTYSGVLATDYVLLVDPTGIGNFSDNSVKQYPATAISGNKITFSAVSLPTGAVFSIQTSFTAVNPTLQATNITFTNITDTGRTLNWTNGDGALREVFILAGTTGSPLPVNNTTYTPDTTFGTGTQIGTTGWYSVYKGAGTSVTVTGLAPVTNYRVMTIEYNGIAGSEVYFSTVSTENPAEINATITGTNTTAPGGVMSGLNLWLDASNGATSTANNLTGWTDITNINTFTVSATPPTVIANAINFHPTINFVNATSPGIYPATQSLIGNTTIVYADTYAVFKVNDGNGGTIIGGTIQGDSYGKAVFSEGGSLMYAGTGNQSTFSSYPFSDYTKFHVFGMNVSIAGNIIGRVDANNQTMTNSVGFSSYGLIPTVGTTNNNGNYNSGWRHLNGQIAEVIIYNASVSLQRINIESYLALKYGIHKTDNYVDSANNIIWDATANAAYHNDVFGFGQDDLSGLNQAISNSMNTGSGDGTGQSGKGNIIINNPSSLVNNGFLLIGHNTSALAETNATIGGYPTKIVQRIWKVQSTGNPGTITLNYDITGLTYSGQNSASSYILLVDPTGTSNFNGGSVAQYRAATVSGNRISFNTVDLPNGSVFTFQTLAAPTIQATNLAFTNTTTTSTTVNWTNGNGSSRAVFIYAGSSGSPLPINNTTYIASTAFGTGTQIGTTGWYCIYNGTGTTVDITGLTAATTYQVMSVEYNGIAGSEVYFPTVSTENPAEILTTIIGNNTTAPGGVTTGINLWLDASNGATSTANNLTGWTDITNINTFTVSATPPTVTANAINFHPTVNFNNSNPVITYPATQNLTGNTNITYVDAYAVFKINNSNGGTVIGSTLPGKGYGRAVFSEASSRMYIGNGTASVLSSFEYSDYNKFHVFSMDKNALTTAIGRIDGDNQSVFNQGSYTSFNFIPAVGTTNNNEASNGWRHLNGQIAEIIIYNQSIALQKINIESYLSLKYGIHKTDNYVDSANNIMWDAAANAAYHNDVFGFGRDDLSGLNQAISNSMNTGSGDGTGQSGKGNIIISNPSSLVNNGFLLIGHNTSPLTTTDITVVGNITKRVDRIWKVQSTGNPGTITLSYDITGLTYAAQKASDYVLLVDPTGAGDFVGGSAILYVASAITGNKVSFDTVDLPTGSVFTFQTLTVPTVQTTDVVFAAITGTTTKASWTNGNGSSRAVFIYAGSSGSPLPVDYTTYTANTTFGSGTQIGTTGWYCVYNGTGTTVDITGLTPATTYQVMTVEYNGSLGNELYLSTVSTGNPAGLTTLNNDATLSNLSISAGILNPVFASGTTSYTATVPTTTTSLTVTPVTTDVNATVTVNDTAVTSGSASGAIALAVGPNVITTIVTAQDGTTIATYTITVTRNVAPPIITSFSPQIGPVGTTVTITGANYSATANQNIVFFGATQATITAATTTSLTVTVPIGASYEPISVLNKENVLMGYSTASFLTSFTPNKGNMTIDDLMPKVDFSTVSIGAGSDIATGDFDGDGKSDLIVTNSLTNNGAVSVFRNTSSTGSITSSSFTSSGNFAVGSSPQGVVAGDLDGDGKLDIVVTNRDVNASTISILRNNSSGSGNISFAPLVGYSANFVPIGVVIYDFDGDGKSDIICTSYNSSNISIYRNISSGIGNISFAPRITQSGFSGAVRIKVGDFDGDNVMDIAVVNYTGATIGVSRNISTIGNITFQAPVIFPANPAANDIAIGDLNNDGKTDIAFGNENLNSLSVLRNISTGAGNFNFAAATVFPLPGKVNRVAIGDIDGDGSPDISASGNTSGLSVLRNISVAGGAINFANKIDFINGATTSAMVIDDFDGDGKSDLAAVNTNNISVFRNNPIFAPTTQATNIIFTNKTGTSATASWTNGNGSSRAVFIYAGSSGSPLPVDYTTYTANTTFGSGTQIGTTGWYCVYNSTGTTVDISGLTPATTYQVMTVEYNGSLGNELYLSTVSTGNPAGLTTLNNDATLSNLSISAGILNPFFASGTTSYTATVPTTTTSLTVTPVTTDVNTTVTVNDTAVTSGSASGAIALAVGPNVITTIVTAQDGTTIATYTITVTRTEPTIVVSGTLSALSSIYGTPSVSETFTVSGTDMAEGILVTSPTGFEVSSDNITFTNTITIGGSGIIPDTPLYIRLKGTIPAGSYSGNIVLTSNNAATVNFATVSSTVNKATLTITADNQTKTYGSANPALTASYSGFVNGDTSASLITPPIISTIADDTSPVGTYVITASGATSDNYTFAYVDGSLSVTPVVLTITADNQTKTYGSANPALTASYSGFVNGDTSASLTTPPIISTTADATSPVGAYVITASGATSDNYTFAYVDGSLSVTPVVLTITADNQSKTYGSANPTLTASYAGFVNGDTSASLTTPPIISTIADATSPVGTYVITASGATSDNYTIAYVDGSLSVTPVVLTITADNQTKVYGSANPALTASYSGFVNGDTVASLTTPPSISTIVDATSPVGTYVITASGAVSDNYTIAYVDGSLSVTPVVLTITADNQTKVYGSANPALTASYSGFVNGDTSASLTTPPTISTIADATSPVGTYVITASGATSDNYTIAYVDGSLTVTPVVLTITADNQTKVYGSANPALTASYSGFVNGDTAASLTTPPIISTIADATSPVGTYVITASGATSDNYTIAYVDGSLEVTKAMLTITADDKVKAYGSANPALTASYSGFVNGDTAANLNTAPTITTTADATSVVGTYPIAASAAIASNYDFTYVDGTLTITSGAVLTITVNNQTKIYGEANPAFTVSYSGFVNGDTESSLTTLPTVTTTADQSSPVGTYTTVASGASAANYTISYVNGTLDVTAANLTITANDQSKTYGSANPALTISYSGFVNGDTATSLTTPPAITTIADATSPVGTYVITASGATSDNYTFAYVDGSLSVTPVVLTITADNQTKVYGSANPALTASYSGFVNGDTSASLTTPPIISTTADATSPVGTYVITAIGATSDNYTIAYVDGTLSITPVVLTITADNQSKTYGSANPTLTASYSGFVNGDTAASLINPPIISTTADATSPVGTYGITASGATSDNYTIAYVDGSLSVTPVVLTITADNQTKVYGDANPALTASYSGFVNGDTSASLTTPPAISTIADATSPVGTYGITASGATSDNYTIAYVDGSLSVTPVVLTITADNKTKTYGSANPALTASYSGFVNGDTSASLTTPPVITTTADATSPVGTYVITASGATSDNYTIAYVDGSLTVTPVVLTITADNQTKTYGSVNPALTASYSGFVNGDTSASLTTPPIISTIADDTSPVGTYVITVIGATSDNYTFAYVDGSLSVTLVVLTITADNQSKVYGSANPALTASYSGFVNGDTSASLTTPPIISTIADATSPVGTYVITASGATSDNYTIAYVDGSLEVTKAMLTITADDKVKAYGSANPALTASYSGFVNGDTSASLVTAPTITTTAITGSNIGTYVIIASGAVDPNYTINYVDGNLTITVATLTITADDKTRAFGLANPVLTATYTGFVNGDTVSGLDTAVTISTIANVTSPVGVYAITVSGAADTNYSINYVTGVLTVTSSVDANLTSLTINNGVLSPVFSPGTLVYNATVEGGITSEIITAIANDPLATITINGVAISSGTASNPIALQSGLNVIVIKVTAEDGVTTKNYTLNITKAGSDIASLSNLSISEGVLKPQFQSDVTSYNTVVKYNVDAIKVTPTVTDPGSKVTVNGVVVANATASAPIRLTAGENTIEIVVTAQDGITKQTYTLVVYKGVSPEDLVVNNILSPNGDGKNDFWEIEDILLYPNNTVTVYDRAGRIVYSKKGYSNEWDGSYSGSPLSNDTYYYLIDFGDDLPKVKGFITMLRD